MKLCLGQNIVQLQYREMTFPNDKKNIFNTGKKQKEHIFSSHLYR